MANLKDLIVNGSARILGSLYATLKGNADTATKLETARTFRTNLGSTSAVGFDGTSNITPGVQGTLPVANGGTGQTSVANIQAGKDADGNVISTTYLKQANQGNLLPNFDAMPVLQTIEFDTADTSWHKIMERTNTESSSADLNDVIYFRITVTGTDINQVGNYALILPGRIGVQPRWIVQMFPGTTSSATSGVRYIRAIYPKNLNNGYGWAIEIINTRNTTARHYKIEVFKTNSKITWLKGVASTYSSTYQSNLQIEVEMRNGYVFDYMYGQVTQSDNATRLNNALNKYLNSTMHTAGAALTGGSFVYQSGNNLYPGTDTTKAIEPGFGIQWNSYSYNSGNSIGWDQIKQKLSVTSLTNVPHDTLVRGNPCYFRCTMDANGNILSDNYVTTSMVNGYTWYYVGLAQSATAIAIDTTQSFFLTLDSNGKVTHINGKQVGGSGGTVDQTYDATSANAQSGVAINGAKFLQNQTSSTYALRLSPGNDSTMPNGNYSIAIGKSTGAQGANSTSIGYYATATGDYSVAIGASAQTTSKSGIQIGRGANVTPYTLSVGFTLSDDSVVSYRLLEGTTGKIPDDRLNTTIARANNYYTKTEMDGNFYSKTDTEVVHTVIETYQNGTNWYRVYDDGWVEQGGMVSVPKTGTSVELLREMTDTNYSILLGGSGTSAGQDGNNVFWYAKTIATISLSNKQYGTDNQTRNCYWYVCGYGAEVFYINPGPV